MPRKDFLGHDSRMVPDILDALAAGDLSRCNELLDADPTAAPDVRDLFE